ncbi:Transcriptional regulatory protein rxt2 [Taphrina deformans PYCC 5710]|uniref:Transcriptional regulatory protein rxt2 n=1 Tax=Taphrina deformans (strain PYCC 5710 / ATCC 11124 / CBS 356.35 / IMI 108563 / JCM 9778 / NBRC 8474) TaxID=1097556 RepID=R4XB26_TAPDE|nr:Transcriptional regulatory protein rxt2 [Taphrina deformans PYCC 5710]|eukprot:CCG83074.1 Transcriptional regulatory protein rxt2 [Taphrina deformans PYCC 5710]
MLEALAARLKEVVDRDDDASDSDTSIGEAQTNRFNKLKRKSRFVSKGRLNVGGGIQTDTTQTFYGSKKRATITSRRYHNASSDDEDAYHDIAIEEILAPINDPAEVVAHPAHRITFRRQTLPLLASHALQTISTEHEHRVQLSRLLTAFLGDDPSLIMQTYEKEIAGTSLQIPLGLAANVVEDGAVPVKAMTRKGAAAEENSALAEEFVTPTYDRNLGIPPDEAEEARRLLQAALDRSEEYLRCMQRVRSGLVKADRYRKRTWRWAKDSLQANDKNDN